MTQPIDWLAIAPPLVVALTALAVLLCDAFGGRRTGALVVPVALTGLAAALLLLLPLRGPSRGAFCMPGGCSYVVDSTTLVFQLVAAGGALVVVLLSSSTDSPGREQGEYLFLLLGSVSGAMTIAAARDLITLVVALELVTLPAIALVGLRRDRRSAEAGLKFFLVSVVSVAVMLFGVSLVYGVTGTVQFEQLARELATGRMAGVTAAGVVLTLAGLAFKIGAVPFHFWVPDTYSGAPIPIAAYLSVVSKAAGVVGLVTVLTGPFAPYAGIWSPIVAVLAAVTMTVGNLVALRQTDAVRLLAWSSIAQAGFVLVPLGALSTGRPGVLGATVAYLLIYAVVNLGAFAVVAMLGGGDLERFRGLFWTHRALALALGFFLLALAGLPPGVAGLFGKVVVVQAAVRGDMTWLAVTAALNVAIGLAYYLRFAALLFARPAGPVPVEPVVPTGPVARPALAGWVAVGLAGVLGIWLSVAPELALSLIDVVR